VAYKLCTNIFIKNTNLYRPGQRRVGHVVINNFGQYTHWAPATGCRLLVASRFDITHWSAMQI